mgnify:CR=1 FL=1
MQKNKSYNMIKLTEYVDKIYESINDKNLFKAVFLCGGPGSGKSFIGELVLSGLGTNTVNSDIMFEALMKTNNISMKIDKSKPDIIKIQDELRERAKKFAKFRETLPNDKGADDEYDYMPFYAVRIRYGIKENFDLGAPHCGHFSGASSPS